LGSDYTGISAVGSASTVTIPAGASNATVVVDPTQDATVEFNETVALTLSAAAGYTVGTEGAVIGSIINDDGVVVSVAALANGNEANGGPALFRFSRTGSLAAPLAVSYSLYGEAQAGTDYAGPASGTVTFSAGSATATLSLPALADSLVDPAETIIARINPSPNGSYFIAPGQQLATATMTAEGMAVAVRGPSIPGASKREVRNATAFAALKGDGTVVSWGDSRFGGTAPQGLGGVTQIYSNGLAFAALKSDRTVVCWGEATAGGTAPGELKNVLEIFSTNSAFAALKSDGTVVCWGADSAGGTAPGGLTNVIDMFSTTAAFAALKSDGTVVSWGDAASGGEHRWGLAVSPRSSRTIMPLPLSRAMEPLSVGVISRHLPG
jgi:hypothetical protein